MLTAEILNGDATLNTFIIIGTLSFLPGEEVEAVIRLKDSNKNLRYIPPIDTIVTLNFDKTDGTTLQKVVTLSAGYEFERDLSMIKFVLEESETEELIGGNIYFDLDLGGTGTSIKKGLIQGALSKEIIDC